MAKSRSIQDIPRIFGEEIRSNCQILFKEFQIILGGIDTRKNGIMWKVALKRLAELLGPLYFFFGNCKKILPWVAPYEKNQLGKSCITFHLWRKHTRSPIQFKLRTLSIPKHLMGNGPDAVGLRISALIWCAWLI